MIEIYRAVTPRKARPGDYLLHRGVPEQITSIAIYPPADRTDEERPTMCPIRKDWWAVLVCTDSGAAEWAGQPEFPGPR